MQDRSPENAEGRPLVDLSRPDSSLLVRGRPRWFEALWYFLGLPLVRTHMLTASPVRAAVLRMFGASIGRDVYFKPGLKVKFPWYLHIGDYSWIGEDVWIDNLTHVRIGKHVCVSQGVYFCTGNHDYKSRNMKLFTGAITLDNYTWVGARTTLCPGCRIREGSVLAAGSVVHGEIAPWQVHGGNPSRFLRPRRVNDEAV